eukprot:TRINITY_DN8705_c0_g1_i1.p1 TRINITY_DN8705_c0_g1~~TRINITY_DN8705_c0_g1_i1.p1  ORF type:complete len:339 (+),score=57.64 TRINITY_DN8705_c0_g1_i1:37-1053(+)
MAKVPPAVIFATIAIFVLVIVLNLEVLKKSRSSIVNYRFSQHLTQVSSPTNNQPQKTLIVCINPGRMGTQFLTTLFNDSKIVSLHEPVPKMTGYFLENAISHPLNYSFNERMARKVPSLEKAVRLWKDNKAYKGYLPWTYAESSNMFIKSWPDIIEGLGPEWNLKVVILFRYLPRALKSQYELGWFKLYNGRGKWYYGVNDISPSQDRQHFRSFKSDEDMNRFEQLIAYNLEIAALAEEFKAKYKDHPRVTIVEAKFEEVTTSLSKAHEMMKDLGLPWQKLNKLPGHINPRDDRKILPTTIEECEMEFNKFLQDCKRHKCKIPNAPNLLLPERPDKSE